MAKKTTARQPGAERILAAALELCAERRWRDVSMEDVAEASGATLQRVHEFFPDRRAFLVALMERTDRAVLSGHDFADAGEPYRERLLDVLMRRFEALMPDRAALCSILRDLGADPLSALGSLPAFAKSMAWSLEAAGIGASGPMGVIRVKGLALIYLSAMRVWLRDDSPDLSATMARLDRDLRRAEMLVTSVARRPRANPADS